MGRVEHDVVVVGARCAGAPLATLLAREGLRVALVEQATFPRDTLSSHIFEADGLAFLNRLGIVERLRATGAPLVERGDFRVEDVRMKVDWPLRPGDAGGIASVRRFVLDPILAETAAEAGVDVRTGAKVTGLISQGGRVAGVRVSGEGGETQLRASLVVGADGRNSTVARHAGSRRYNVVPNQRALYWAFFEGADMGSRPTFTFHRWGRRFLLGMPSDEGLFQVVVWLELDEVDAFRSDPEGTFMEHALSCEPMARTLSGATRKGKFLGAVRWLGFFREASGPGWVLAGDAGHFKDPAPGRGMSDAFMQADALAPAIVAGLRGSPQGLDEAMAAWGRWRDAEFAEHYWFANDMGKAGSVPRALPEVLRGLKEAGKLDLFLDLMSHRAKPTQVMTPPRLMAATGRLLARGDGGRASLLREVGGLMGEDVRRRRLNRRPAYEVAAGAERDAGATEPAPVG